MMAQDQGDIIIEGSDYLEGIDFNRLHRGVLDEGFDGDGVDEDYSVFLSALGCFVGVGKGVEVDKCSASARFEGLSIREEEVREDPLNIEKMLDVTDCDVPREEEEDKGGEVHEGSASDQFEVFGGREEEIQEVPLNMEKTLDGMDYDVPREEEEADKGGEVDEGSSSDQFEVLSAHEEEIREDPLNMEKTLDVMDCDVPREEEENKGGEVDKGSASDQFEVLSVRGEEIREFPLNMEKPLDVTDCNVSQGDEEGDGNCDVPQEEEGGKGGKVDEGSASAQFELLSGREGEIREDPCNMEKTMDVMDCDVPQGEFEVLSGHEEEIREDLLNMEKTLDDMDCDVPQEEEEEEDYDPQYLLFFQNLKPCGTGYVLEVATRGGTKILKYEDEDEDEFQSSDERKRKVRNPVSRHSPRAGRSNLLPREMKNLEIGSARLQGLRNTRLASRRDVSAPSAVDVPGQNVKQKTTDKEKWETPNCTRGSSRASARKQPMGFVRSDDSEEGRIQHQSCVRSRFLSRCGEQISKGEKDKCKAFQIPYNHKVDKAYYLFLKCLSISRNSIIYKDKDGNQCRYDESTDESGSDSDTEGSPKPPPSSGRMTPKPSNKRLVPFDKRVPSNQEVGDSSSNFRQKVMDVLLKPYDRKEHQKLLKEAKQRKPIVRHKDLRGGRSAEYLDKTNMGRSYLDHHQDLKKKIIAVERDDPPKALLLLRGLFVYLQSLCMEDQFKPWNDDLWLKAMNRSTS